MDFLKNIKLLKLKKENTIFIKIEKIKNLLVASTFNNKFKLESANISFIFNLLFYLTTKIDYYNYIFFTSIKTKNSTYFFNILYILH